MKIYGWLENSYTQNTNGRPSNDSNFSVSPNRGANQWQGNQHYFIVEIPLESNVDHVNLGFRVTLSWQRLAVFQVLRTVRSRLSRQYFRRD